MQDALARRHMGDVIRAFREHPRHGRKAIPQGTVADWIGITQAQVSRIENGPAIVDLNRLTDWALLLRIPKEHLWFSLPEENGDVKLKRSHFLQLSGFTISGVANSGPTRTQSCTTPTSRWARVRCSRQHRPHTQLI